MKKSTALDEKLSSARALNQTWPGVSILFRVEELISVAVSCSFGLVANSKIGRLSGAKSAGRLGFSLLTVAGSLSVFSLTFS